MKTISILLFCLLLILLYKPAFCQENAKKQRIETLDGNEYNGVIVSSDSISVLFQTDNIGPITIQRKDIRHMTEIDSSKIIEGKVWFENPQATRYFWAPNGFGLNEGESYYQNVWVLFNQFVYGVTDNFSFGGGTVPLFIFDGAPTPIWLTPKLSIPITPDKFNIGVGALLGTVLGESETGFGILYGIATLGNRDKNVSFGAGYGYAGGSFAQNPALTISFMVRTGQRGYLISENYIFPGSDGFGAISIGGRRIIKNAGLDFGAIIPVGDIGAFIVLPWLGFTIPMGK